MRQPTPSPLTLPKASIDEFFKFIYERQLIYHKRHVLKLPSPWTEDLILQKFKFCNIYRFLDKGTLYIYNKLLNPKLNYSKDKVLFNTVLYRLFNRVDFFDGDVLIELIDPKVYNFHLYVEIFHQVQKRHSLYNPAYLICSQKVFKFESHVYNGKYVQILLVLEWLVNNLESILTRLDAALNPKEQLLILQSIPLIGEFTSGQILVDLSYSGVTKYTNNDICILGPGSAYCCHFLNIPKTNDSIIYLRDIQKDYLKEEWIKIAYKDNNYPYLSTMDIQNSMCEFHKYWKYKHGLGRKKYYKESK